MHYRVAIQRQGDQLDRPPNWQWTSTVLSSLQTLFQFLRLYSSLGHDHLRVFSCSSRVGLEEQLMQENLGLGSPSVTAARFLQERLLHSTELEGGASQPMASIAVAPQPLAQIRSREGNGAVGRSMSSRESRRLELERGSRWRS